MSFAFSPLRRLGAPLGISTSTRSDRADELRNLDEVEIVAEPELSLLAFRVHRKGLDDGALDALNRRVMEAVNARRRVYITSTTVGGRFLIRICVLSLPYAHGPPAHGPGGHPGGDRE